MTGLGTPVANLLVPDLVAYAGPGTTYSGPTVGPLQDATLADPGTAGGGAMDVFSVFDALAVTGRDPGRPLHRTPSASPSGGTASHHVHDNPDTSGALHAVAVNTVVAPARATGTGTLGITPLGDALAVHDDALAGWSSPGPESPSWGTTRSNQTAGPAVNTRTDPVPGQSRTVVAQAIVVNAAVEELGALSWKKME